MGKQETIPFKNLMLIIHIECRGQEVLYNRDSA